MNTICIGPHEDLTIGKRRKLQWYGHVSRSSGLAKPILQGTVKGGRRQGRQKKRWEDNLFVWSNCLLDLGTDFLIGNMSFNKMLTILR